MSRPATSFSKHIHGVRIKTRSMSPANTFNAKTTRFKEFSGLSKLINFDAAPVLKTAETFELTNQLKILKNKLNQTKLEWNSIENNLNSTKSELSSIETKEKTVESRIFVLKTRKKHLKESLNSVYSKIDDSASDNECYLGMKERMRLTKFFLEMKFNRLQENIDTKDDVCKGEIQKKNKIFENIGRNAKNLKDFSLNYDWDIRQRSLISRQIDRDTKNKQTRIVLREDMKKRRDDIVESVANEEKMLKNNLLREGVLLHQTWYKYLEAKFVKETDKYKSVEKAFITIKSVTGISNVKEIAKKIITKESNFVALMKMINETKAVVNNYKEKNSKLDYELSQLKVKEKTQKSDIFEQKDYIKASKTLGKSKEKLKKLENIQLFILVWVKNILSKFCPNIEYPNDLKFLFTTLSSLVKTKIVKKRPQAWNKSNKGSQWSLSKPKKLRSMSIYDSASSNKEEESLLTPTLRPSKNKRKSLAYGKTKPYLIK